MLRSGARPGDILALAGTVGRAAAGLALLESAIPVDDLHPEQRALVDTQCRPVPPLAAGPLARDAGATAMMDISDGLVRDGARMAAASGVVLDLDPAALKTSAAAAGARRGPAGQRIRWPGCWAAARTTDCSPPSRPDVQLPHGFTAIGSVQASCTDEGTGVTIAGRPADTVGWDHFAD